MLERAARITWKDFFFATLFYAAISALLLGFIILAAPSAAAQAKDKNLAAECDAQIKKQKDWDQFAKRRYLEQCLQQGVKPPKGDPATPPQDRR